MFNRDEFYDCKTEKDHCAKLVILLNRRGVYMEKDDELTYDFQESVVIATLIPAKISNIH